MHVWIDRVLVQVAVPAGGRAAVVRVGELATGHVVPGLGAAPIPWRGRAVEVRVSAVGHPFVGVDLEVRCDGEPVPPLWGASPGPFAGPACPACGGAADAVDGTRCRSCFAADRGRQAAAVRRQWGGLGLLLLPIAGITAFGAWAAALPTAMGVSISAVSGMTALLAVGTSALLLARAWRAAPWPPPVAAPRVTWNLDVLRALERPVEPAERGPAWDRMKDSLVSTIGG